MRRRRSGTVHLVEVKESGYAELEFDPGLPFDPDTKGVPMVRASARLMSVMDSRNRWGVRILVHDPRDPMMVYAMSEQLPRSGRFRDRLVDFLADLGYDPVVTQESLRRSAVSKLSAAERRALNL